MKKTIWNAGGTSISERHVAVFKEEANSMYLGIQPLPSNTWVWDFFTTGYPNGCWGIPQDDPDAGPDSGPDGSM